MYVCVNIPMYAYAEARGHRAVCSSIVLHCFLFVCLFEKGPSVNLGLTDPSGLDWVASEPPGSPSRPPPSLPSCPGVAFM